MVAHLGTRRFSDRGYLEVEMNTETLLNTHIYGCIQNRTRLRVRSLAGNVTIDMSCDEPQHYWTTSPNVYKYTNRAMLKLCDTDRVCLSIRGLDFDLQGPCADPVKKLDMAAAALRRDGFEEHGGGDITKAIRAAIKAGEALDVRSLATCQRLHISAAALAGEWVRVA